MYVQLAVLKETHPHEKRVALVPAGVPELVKLGAQVSLQAGAGAAAGFPDAAYQGAAIVEDRGALVRGADVVLAVQAPSLEVIDAMKKGAVLACFFETRGQQALLRRLSEQKVTCFSMDRVPRISRAQAMDALSSQSALAGYYAVALGTTHLSRVLPQITTAAGVLGPAHVLVMGLGVAGLEAVATAHRLGALVEGYDVRAVTKEQVLSLGATFVDTGVDASGQGGYARELTDAENAKVNAVLTKHIQSADLIITTAAVPGRAAPKLISRSQAAGMKAGSVIIDLAAEGGGNCDDTVPGETMRAGPVTIVAPLNVPSLLAEDASKLYSKNLYNLLALFMKDNVVAINWGDEILAKSCVTHHGAGKHGAPKDGPAKEGADKDGADKDAAKAGAAAGVS